MRDASSSEPAKQTAAHRLYLRRSQVGERDATEFRNELDANNLLIPPQGGGTDHWCAPQRASR